MAAAHALDTVKLVAVRRAARGRLQAAHAGGEADRDGGVRVAVIDRVGAVAARQDVRARAAHQGILAVAAIERIVAGLAVEKIVAATAMLDVIAETAPQAVDATVAAQAVGVSAATRVFDAVKLVAPAPCRQTPIAGRCRRPSG